MNRMTVFFIAIFLAALSLPAAAQMHHYTVGAPPEQKAVPPASQKTEGEPAEEGEDYGGGSFSVTPVQDCFGKLKPGEAAEIRKNYSGPYQECQKRLKQREAEEKKEKEKPPVDPCAESMASYQIYVACQDRVQKIQRLKDAAQSRQSPSPKNTP